VAALILSFLLLAGMFLLENKVLNQKEIERLVDVPLLGVVPTFKNNEMKFSKIQIFDFPTSRISESFRDIRSKLDFFGDSNSSLITISSTISGEGKTFITLNLSGIVALSDKRVIVLDCDMRKPKLHMGFGVDNQKGVSDLLIGRATLGSCILKSSIKNLDFITAGSIPPNPSELILSKKFDQLLEELRSEYDVIIFDTPPIGLVTDGIHIMNKSDVQIYVARAEYTTLSMIKDIQQIKDTRGFSNFSIVLNDVPYSEYSYGYSGYSYGYYDDENKID
jgi:capsular exopolysaccharide synthesis family protein